MGRFMPVFSFRLQPHVIATLLALNAMGAMAQTPSNATAENATTLSTVTVEASADASASVTLPLESVPHSRLTN